MNKKLSDIEKKNQFEVPDGYFEDLPLRIQKRIESEQQRKQTIALPSWSLAMAASIALIIVSVYLLQNNPSSSEDLLAEISEEDLIAYIDELEISSYDIATTFPDITDYLLLDDVNIIEDVDLEDQAIDDLLLEYNIEDLEI